MSGATDEFFDGLARVSHVPALARQRATIRFDITNHKKTEHRRVTIEAGDITLATSGEDADCIIAADRHVFDDILDGRLNEMASVIRGTVLVDGDPELLVLTRRLLPAVGLGGGQS